MTKSENNQLKRDSSKKRSSKKKLPWWVELFFVQIGLPEKLLQEILKLNTNTKEHIKRNNKYYLFSLILLSTAVYINPVITNYKNNNQCVKEVKKLLSAKQKISPSIIAVNHCRGGEGKELY